MNESEIAARLDRYKRNTEERLKREPIKQSITTVDEQLTIFYSCGRCGSLQSFPVRSKINSFLTNSYRHHTKMSDEQKKLEILDWLASLIPSAVVIDVDAEGNPTDLSQINELRERIETEIKEIRSNDEQ
jgi:hypothetical protein